MANKKKQVKKQKQTRDTNTLTLLSFVKEYAVLLFPIILSLCILPLIVSMRIVELDEGTALFYGETQFDLYAIARSQFLIFVGVSAVILAVVRLLLFDSSEIKKLKPFKIYFIFAGIFTVFTLLSSIFSSNIEVAFSGFYMHAEGFISQFFYIILFAYSIYCCNIIGDLKIQTPSKKQIDPLYFYIVIPLLITFACNVFVSIFQYLGDYLIHTDIGKLFVFGPEYAQSVSDIAIPFATGTLFGTFFNPNYAGVYGVLMLPIFFMIAIKQKRIIFKLLFFLLFVLCLIFTYLTNSQGALVAIILTSIFAIVIYFKEILKHKIFGVVVLACAFVSVFFANFITGGKLVTEIALSFSQMTQLLTPDFEFDYRDSLPVRNIEIDNGNIVVETNEDIFTIDANIDTLTLTGSNIEAQEVEILIGNSFSLPATSNGIVDFKFLSKEATSNANMLIMSINSVEQFWFTLNSEQDFALASPYNFTEIELDNPEIFPLLNGKENLGSNRGYIWSRAIPLMKDNIVIGAGPDNFIFEFPQYDFLGKLYTEGTINMIYSKPHNMYIQIFINNGGVAFTAFALIMIFYVIDCFKIFFNKKENTFRVNLGIGIFLAVIAYLTNALFTDSMVYFAPIFWIVLGIGISINKQIKETRKKHEN